MTTPTATAFLAENADFIERLVERAAGYVRDGLSPEAAYEAALRSFLPMANDNGIEVAS